MEWVEVTAKTVEEARELALDKLGVHDSEAEFQVLEEASSKMFGLRKTEARVRARVSPKAPAPRKERRDRKKKSDKRRNDRPGNKQGSGRQDGGRDSNQGGSGDSGPSRDSGGSSSGSRNRSRNRNRSGGGRNVAAAGAGAAAGQERSGKGRQNRNSSGNSARPQEESNMSTEDVAKTVEDFLGGLVSAMGLDDTPVINITEDEAVEASLPGRHGLLIGPKGRTLDAVQELARTAANRTGATSTRIRVDIGAYRETRREKLAVFARAAAARTRDEQVEVVLEPMNSADRKVVHDTLVEEEGVSTRSVGNEPRRRVVIVPDAPDDNDDGVEDFDDAEPAGE